MPQHLLERNSADPTVLQSAPEGSKGLKPNQVSGIFKFQVLPRAEFLTSVCIKYTLPTLGTDEVLRNASVDWWRRFFQADWALELFLL